MSELYHVNGSTWNEDRQENGGWNHQKVGVRILDDGDTISVGGKIRVSVDELRSILDKA